MAERKRRKRPKFIFEAIGGIVDIQALHMQNNFYRDLIVSLKAQINDYDKKIQINELMIGSQLGDMERLNSGVPGDCTLCMGECENHGDNDGI